MAANLSEILLNVPREIILKFLLSWREHYPVIVYGEAPPSRDGLGIGTKLTTNKSAAEVRGRDNESAVSRKTTRYSNSRRASGTRARGVRAALACAEGDKKSELRARPQRHSAAQINTSRRRANNQCFTIY